MRIASLLVLVACGGAPVSEGPRVLSTAGATAGAAPKSAVAPAPKPSKITAAGLLTEAMVRSLDGYDDELTRGMLDQDPRSGSYDDVHYKAIGQAENYDVALRVWMLDGQAAVDKFEELRTSLGKTTELDELEQLADRALIAAQDDIDILGVGFLDRRGLVVLITCGRKQCHSVADVIDLGKRVYRRVPKTWKLPSP